MGVSCELVDSHGVGLVSFRVVLFDDFEVVHEDSEPILIFLRCDFEKHRIVIFPLLVEFARRGLGSGSEKRDCSNGSDGSKDSDFESFHKDIFKIFSYQVLEF